MRRARAGRVHLRSINYITSQTTTSLPNKQHHQILSTTPTKPHKMANGYVALAAAPVARKAEELTTPARMAIAGASSSASSSSSSFPPSHGSLVPRARLGRMFVVGFYTFFPLSAWSWFWSFLVLVLLAFAAAVVVGLEVEERTGTGQDKMGQARLLLFSGRNTHTNKNHRTTVSGAQPSSSPPGVAGSCGVRFYYHIILPSSKHASLHALPTYHHYQEETGTAKLTRKTKQPSPSSPNGTLSSRPSATTSDPSTTARRPSRMACFDFGLGWCCECW